MTSSPVGETMRWAAAAGTRYWAPHCAARRTSTGSPTVRPITDHERSSPAGRRRCRPGRPGRSGVGGVDTECSTSQAAVPLPVAYWILRWC